MDGAQLGRGQDRVLGHRFAHRVLDSGISCPRCYFVVPTERLGARTRSPLLSNAHLGNLVGDTGAVRPSNSDMELVCSILDAGIDGRTAAGCYGLATRWILPLATIAAAGSIRWLGRCRPAAGKTVAGLCRTFELRKDDVCACSQQVLP